MRRLPPGTITPAQTRALLAVVGGARTVREVAAACGLSAPHSAHLHLKALRAAGLVTWEDGRMGTLRPTVDFAAWRGWLDPPRAGDVCPPGLRLVDG